MGLQSSTIVCKGGQRYPHYYLCNYRPKISSSDALSASLIRFKKGKKEDMQAWIDCTVQEIVKLPYMEGTIVLRALHAEEIFAGSNEDQALDQLGKNLSVTIHGAWNPSALQKARITLPLKTMGRRGRQVELENVYSSHLVDKTIKRVVIIDDIVTTGTTACSIIQSLRKVCKNVSFIVFSLAKADYLGAVNKAIVLKGASYQWNEQQWKVAEEKEISRGELMQWILRDSFPDVNDF